MAGKTKRVVIGFAVAVFMAPLLSSSSSSAQSVPLLNYSGSTQSSQWLSTIKPALQPSAVAEFQPKLLKRIIDSGTTLKKMNEQANCTSTQLSIVAHQDDDILFMNPDLQESIQNGVCTRTVYITAGDNGSPANYWQERERGPQAAYAAMYGAPDIWTMSTEQLAGQTVTEYRLASDARVSLLYFRLPDGYLTGTGFETTGHQSLEKLLDGTIPVVDSIDGQSHYNQAQLVDSLRTLMTVDDPQILNVQAAAEELAGGDHSDHQAVGNLTNQAASTISGSPAIRHYLSYQVNGENSNLDIEKTAHKQAIFTAYAAHDSQVCNSVSDCFNDFVYQPYYSRQYLR